MGTDNRSSLRLFRSLPNELGVAHHRGLRPTWHFLAVLLSCLSFVPFAFGFPQKEKPSDAPNTASSIAGNVSVIAGQGQANSLAGVSAKISEPNTGSALQSTVTDESGRFQFAHLTAGTYTLEVSADGFKPWAKTIELARSQTAVQDVRLEINSVVEQIDVQAENIEISTNNAETSATISDRQLDTLPLAQQKFTEALPLTPGVIRTPEGKLNFNGQSENQGTLLVNSTETVDPVTGSFAVPVPVDVIQSMRVHSSPDTAEFGGFSGGLTQIETKPPFDAWNLKLHDVTPSFRGKNDHLVGIGEFTPRLLFGGPLIKDKLNFTEELTYEVNNLAVRGLSWPFNETKTRSITSFTQFQYVLSPRHLLDVDLNIFPLRTQFANISALVPQSASSDYGQNGVSVGISDSYQFSSGSLLNTVVRYTRFDSHAHGQGAEDMLVTPDGWGGNFFNS